MVPAKNELLRVHVALTASGVSPANPIATDEACTLKLTNVEFEQPETIAPSPAEQSPFLKFAAVDAVTSSIYTCRAASRTALSRTCWYIPIIPIPSVPNIIISAIGATNANSRTVVPRRPSLRADGRVISPT